MPALCRTLQWLVVLYAISACSLSAGETVPDPRPAGISDNIHASALEWFDAYIKSDKLAELPPLAEKIADKLIAGGNLYVSGDPAFADEWNYRAGGLAGVTIWKPGTRMGPNDVMVLGITTPNERTSRVFQHGVITEGYGGFTQALTVYIGSLNWPQLVRMKEMALTERFKSGLHFIDTNAPVTEGWANICTGQVATLAVSWALHVEIVSALTRKGKTPAVFGSIFAPGGSEYAKTIEGKNIIAEPKIEPVEAGKLGREYLEVCRKQIAAFRDKGGNERLRGAAQKIAECHKRGGLVFTLADGHFWPKGASIPPSLSRVFFYGPGWQWENFKGMKPEDTLLYFGYIKYPKDAVDAALKAGSDAIVFAVDEITAQERVTAVQLTWENYDGVLTIPNLPYKPGPSSAVVQLPQWYSLVAEGDALMKQ
ncbi:MAG TPA: hypothetical protein VEJ63_13540 [Planctomycetota bacterium]|nr:hypothetical protein [Planctomycetota bacterium]